MNIHPSQEDGESGDKATADAHQAGVADGREYRPREEAHRLRQLVPVPVPVDVADADGNGEVEEGTRRAEGQDERPTHCRIE